MKTWFTPWRGDALKQRKIKILIALNMLPWCIASVKELKISITPFYLFTNVRTSSAGTFFVQRRKTHTNGTCGQL